MKRTILLISIFVAINCVCNAQVDTLRKTSDSLTVKAIKVNTIDSLTAVAPSDSLHYALLYVYRPGKFVGSLIGYNIRMINPVFKDSLIGRATNDSKFVVKLYQEGKIQVFAHTETKRTVDLDVKFGEKYYLKCEIVVGVFVGRPRLSLISPEQGKLDYDNIGKK